MGKVFSIPPAAALVVNRLRLRVRCVGCDEPIAESYHSVLIACGCSDAVGLCQRCWAEAVALIEAGGWRT